MSKKEATDFIAGAGLQKEIPEQWVDMGCGSGLFSFALAKMLCKGSKIYAVDKANSFSQTNKADGIETEFIQTDFIKDVLPLTKLNGILMANALHYVAEKAALINKYKSMLLSQHIFIIIEYDTVHANRWVPYPVNFIQLKELFLQAGYNRIEKISERNSIYNNAKMYAAVIKA